MEFVFKVKRKRRSVTQGEATVSLNDIEILTFADNIELISKGKDYFGKNIGGYASTVPDVDFVKAAIYHKCDNIYRYSDKVKEVFEKLG